jgi:hypothetical protein
MPTDGDHPWLRDAAARDRRAASKQSWDDALADLASPNYGARSVAAAWDRQRDAIETGRPAACREQGSKRPQRQLSLRAAPRSHRPRTAGERLGLSLALVAITYAVGGGHSWLTVL